MPVPDDLIRATVVDLLGQRAPTATICPSEVARTLAPEQWRPLMPRVRELAIAMAAEGLLEVRQRGRVVPPGDTLRGPIRLGRAGTEVSGHPKNTPYAAWFAARNLLRP